LIDVKAQANELWLARQQGGLTPFPDQALSVQQAYELQTACTKASGESLCGYKIGATSDETLALLGLAEPFYGPMFRSFTAFAEPNVTLELPLHAAHNPRIEAEFIVCMKNDVQRQDKNIALDDLLEHIDWVAPGFEFVGSRFSAAEGSRGTSAISDFGAHQYSVIGSAFKNWQSLDLQSHPLSLSINAKTVATGHSGLSIYGNPLAFVCWLLNQPAMANGLKAGELISCGTCTGAIAVKTGDVIRADYAVMGELTVQVANG